MPCRYNQSERPLSDFLWVSSTNFFLVCPGNCLCRIHYFQGHYWWWSRCSTIILPTFFENSITLFEFYFLEFYVHRLQLIYFTYFINRCAHDIWCSYTRKYASVRVLPPINLIFLISVSYSSFLFFSLSALLHLVFSATRSYHLPPYLHFCRFKTIFVHFSQGPTFICESTLNNLFRKEFPDFYTNVPAAWFLRHGCFFW